MVASAHGSFEDEQAAWCRWHRLLATLDPSAPPRAILPAEPGDARAPAASRRVGVLAGSFNPVTLAHVELARAAVRHGELDRLYFMLAARTVDKERVTGLTLEDRLITLTGASRDAAGPFGIALCNRGLYVEQAEAMRAALPPGTELWFVVGWDKIVQIFDQRYYADGDDALRRLFALARFLVAPRGDADDGALAELVGRPANAPYADRVRALAFEPAWRDLSSSLVRAELASGRPSARFLPSSTAAFLARTRAFDAAGDAYAARCAELERRCAGSPESLTQARQQMDNTWNA